MVFTYTQWNAVQLEELNLGAAPIGLVNWAETINVSSFIISKEDMGVINRKGEGHIIYYLDEDAPITPGLPAVTDTSVVSTDTRYLWKSVIEGNHTFSIQLVNNDDTPLDIPIVKVITLDMKP